MPKRRSKRSDDEPLPGQMRLFTPQGQATHTRLRCAMCGESNMGFVWLTFDGGFIRVHDKCADKLVAMYAEHGLDVVQERLKGLINAQSIHRPR